jgi:hypothetical protein
MFPHYLEDYSKVNALTHNFDLNNLQYKNSRWHAVAQLAEATSRQVAGSIPDVVN